MKPETEYQILLTRFRIKKFLQDQWPLLGHTRGGGLSHFAVSLQQGVSSNAVHIYDFHTFTVIYREKKCFTRELE